MANPLFQSMQQNQSNLMNTLQNLKQNPMQLLSKKYNIPQSIANDPSAIIQHLMNSGQVSQAQYNRAMQIAKQFSQR